MALLSGILAVPVPCARAQQNLAFQFDRILAATDTSGSPLVQEYAAVTRALGRQLTDLVVATGAREVMILPWAGPEDALRSASRFSVPPRPVLASAPVFFSEGESLIREARERRVADEKTLQEERRTNLEHAYRLTVEQAVLAAAQQLQVTKQGEHCTCFEAILRRAALEPPGTLCLIVTDGVSTCGAASPIPATLPLGSRVVVILTPATGKTAKVVTVFEEELSRVRRLAPWIQVVPSFIASGPIDQWLLPLLSEHGEAYSLSGSTGK